MRSPVAEWLNPSPPPPLRLPLPLQWRTRRLKSPRAGHSVSLSDDCGHRSHSDTIRGICFSVSGALFASAGDDRLVKVWKTDLWRCIQTITSEKRVSAVAISKNDLSFHQMGGSLLLLTGTSKYDCCSCNWLILLSNVPVVSSIFYNLVSSASMLSLLCVCKLIGRTLSELHCMAGAYYEN
ncbi:uncharacterized protein [Miscanthus floridulus]|uniref:uncharacterized protein n=1 Tax=Miscanthus floridulus TaxID=154761 RepID=UPI0034592721